MKQKKTIDYREQDYYIKIKARNTSLKSEPVWFIKGSIGMAFLIKSLFSL